MIMVFDNKQLLCATSIGDFLLPSPIAYNKITDSFIIQSASYSLRSYRYASIAVKSNSKNKQLGPDWSLNLGEEAMEIIPIWRSEKQIYLLVLSESIVFIVS